MNKSENIETTEKVLALEAKIQRKSRLNMIAIFGNRILLTLRSKTVDTTVDLGNRVRLGVELVAGSRQHGNLLGNPATNNHARRHGGVHQRVQLFRVPMRQTAARSARLCTR